MTTKIDAIIAALAIARDEAITSDELDWPVDACNRWIALLPGSWRGRWRHLKLEPGINGEIERERFIGHVEATLAFLETNRNSLAARPGWWPWRSTTAAKAAHADKAATAKPSLRLVD